MIVDFDPVAIVFGPLAIRWYGFAYLVGFVSAWWWAKHLIRRFSCGNHQGITPKMIDGFMTYAILGVIFGGRLGQVVFYYPEYYFQHPLEIFQIWQGGMAFHGGVIGVLVAIALFARRHGIAFRALGDLVCAGVPIGLLLGRIANFLNGELWGRVTDVPWGVVFPFSGTMDLRHPSPLYEAALEGVLLFGVLCLLIFRLRALQYLGMISGAFLLGYGVLRSIAELFREPDGHIGLFLFGTSWGQWLSVPMILAGGSLIWYALRTRKPHA
ncbi:MAG: prolipoprotein diacylglyceryl transferase [Alphaproteobacteria bacterium]|nr:prolipoprotein diacylglyceryl transferase [Alphaproteobacteria bacterium]